MEHNFEITFCSHPLIYSENGAKSYAVFKDNRLTTATISCDCGRQAVDIPSVGIIKERITSKLLPSKEKERSYILQKLITAFAI